MNPDCPVCSGFGRDLGSLGRTRHYVCRDCGLQFSRTPKVRKPSINALLKPLGVKVLAARCGSRYLGYSYFVSLTSGMQVGDSVMVYRQSDMTHAQWVEHAKSAIESHTRYGAKLAR